MFGGLGRTVLGVAGAPKQVAWIEWVKPGSHDSESTNGFSVLNHEKLFTFSRGAESNRDSSVPFLVSPSSFRLGLPFIQFTLPCLVDWVGAILTSIFCRRHDCYPRSPSGAVGALSRPFFGWEETPTKIDDRNKWVPTYSNPSNLEDLGNVTA